MCPAIFSEILSATAHANVSADVSTGIFASSPAFVSATHFADVLSNLSMDACEAVSAGLLFTICLTHTCTHFLARSLSLHPPLQLIGHIGSCGPTMNLFLLAHNEPILMKLH